MKKKTNRNPSVLKQQTASIQKANERWLNSNGTRANTLDHPWSQSVCTHPRNVDLIDLI